MKYKKYFLVGFAVLVVITVIPVLYLLKDPTSHYMFRRSMIISVTEGDPEIIDNHVVQLVHIKSASGLKVDLALKIPDDSVARFATGDSEDPSGYQEREKRPAALIMGGFETGRDAVKYIGDTRGIVTAALSYPYEGDRRAKGMGVVKQIPAIRRGVRDTPPAAMLALDYLAQRPDVDARQIELIGVSLGALFVPAIGALDDRPRRVWSLHGAGAPYTMLEFNLRPYIESKVLRHIATTVAYVLVNGNGIAPENWVADISPRPFIMINAREDEKIPREAIDVLYNAAKDPKELVWMDGKHVMGGRVEIIQGLIDLVFERMEISAKR